MYVILDTNGYEICRTKELTYIKLGASGCWTIASAGDAEGISVYGIQYNTQDLHGVPDAPIVTIMEKTDDGIPRKGKTDEVLTKRSDSDYDVEWRRVGGMASYVDNAAWDDFMRAVTIYRMGGIGVDSEDMDDIKWFTEKYEPGALNFEFALRADTSGTLFKCTWKEFMDRIYSLLDDIEYTDDTGSEYFDWGSYEINMNWKEFAFFLAHGWETWEYEETPSYSTINSEASGYMWRWQGSGKVTNPYIMKDGTKLYYWNDLTKRWENAN